MDLIRRNYQVWIGTVNNLEVDFIVRNNDGIRQYVQVSQTVQDKVTQERELTPLNTIPDHFEKLLFLNDGGALRFVPGCPLPTLVQTDFSIG